MSVTQTVVLFRKNWNNWDPHHTPSPPPLSILDNEANFCQVLVMQELFFYDF